MLISYKNVLEFLKRDFGLVSRNSLLLTAIYFLLIPVIRGISNLNHIQSAQCFSQSVALIGIIILVPITQYELDMSIKEIVCTKTWSYLKSVIIRLFCDLRLYLSQLLGLH